jgi:hypothetical protein
VTLNFPDFYLAAQLLNIDAVIPPTYGWIHIQQVPQGNGLFALVSDDNAVSYNVGGIIVGTLTEVPEPSSIVLLAMTSACLLWRARR